jgi:hypothetical protein
VTTAFCVPGRLAQACLQLLVAVAKVPRPVADDGERFIRHRFDRFGSREHPTGLPALQLVVVRGLPIQLFNGRRLVAGCRDNRAASCSRLAC